MKKIISFLLMLLLLSALLGGCGKKEEPVASGLEQSERVVILVLEGLPSRLLNRLGSGSALAKIAQEGAAGLSMRCVYPAQSLVNHTTIMTGVFSGTHGILGDVRPAEDGSPIKNDQSDRIKVPTIFSLAKAQGLKTALVCGKGDLVTLFSKDCDVEAGSLSYLPAAPDPQTADSEKAYCQAQHALTRWVLESAYTVLETEAPDLTLVSVPAADAIGHRFGPESSEMETCLKELDKALGEFYNEMKESGMLEHTTLIIVSDHGMTETENTIDLKTLAASNFPAATVLTEGRNGYLWLNGTNELDVVTFLADVEGIASVFSRHSDIAGALGVDAGDAPDLLVESEPGYAFLSSSESGVLRGQHGASNSTDMTVPMILVGGGIPAGAGIDTTDLRSVAPLVRQLLDFNGGDFEVSAPVFLNGQDLSRFKK